MKLSPVLHVNWVRNFQYIFFLIPQHCWWQFVRFVIIVVCFSKLFMTTYQDIVSGNWNRVLMWRVQRLFNWCKLFKKCISRCGFLIGIRKLKQFDLLPTFFNSFYWNYVQNLIYFIDWKLQLLGKWKFCCLNRMPVGLIVCKLFYMKFN